MAWMRSLTLLPTASVQRISLVSALALVAAGCNFQSKIDNRPGLVIVCGPQNECPPGRSPIVTTDGTCRCLLPPYNTDSTLPFVVDAGLILADGTPATGFLKRGDPPVFAVIQLSETLAHVEGEPLLKVTVPRTLSENGAVVDDINQLELVAREEPDNGPPTYKVAYRVKDNEIDGRRILFLTAYDLAENGLVDHQTDIHFDVDNTTPRVDPTSSVVPVRSAPGRSVYIRAVVSERVREDAGTRVVLSFSDTGKRLAEWPASGTANQSVTFLPLIPRPEDGGMGTRMVRVTIDSLVDLAGNYAEAKDTYVGEFQLDLAAPTVTPLGLDGLRRSRNPGFNTFTVPVRVIDAKSVELCVGEICETRAADSAGVANWDAPFTVTASDTEGPHVVVVKAVNESGAESVQSAVVLYDFSPPQLLTASQVTATAPNVCTNTITSVDAGTVNGGISLSFQMNERLDYPDGGSQLDVQTDNPNLKFRLLTGLPTGELPYFTYILAADAGITASTMQGTWALWTFATDSVGNATPSNQRINLGWYAIDTTAPHGLDAGNRLKMVFERFPWGGAEPDGGVIGDGGAAYRVKADPATFDPNSTVVIYDAVNSNRVELGRARVNSTGGFAPTFLTTVDRPLVYLRVFDDACNPASALPEPVGAVEWTATMGGKTPGSSNGNPHRFEEHDYGVERDTRIAPRREVGSVVAQRDLNTITSVTDWTIAVQHAGAVPSDSVPAGAVYDTGKKRVLLFDNRNSEIWTYEWNGTFREIATPAAGEVPRVTGGAAFAFDDNRRRVVMFGGGSVAEPGTSLNDTWEFNGARWTLVTPVDAIRPPARKNAALVYDKIRGKTVLFGGRDVDGTSAVQKRDLWEWDGKRWTNVAISGSWPTARSDMAAAWDPFRGAVAIYGGNTANGAAVTPSAELWEWSGTVWSQKASNTGLTRAAMTRDPYTGGTGNFMVVWGGIPLPGAGFNYLYSWTNDVWSPTNIGSLNSPPPQRAGAYLAYDESKNVAVMFGPMADGGTGSEVWTLGDRAVLFGAPWIASEVFNSANPSFDTNAIMYNPSTSGPASGFPFFLSETAPTQWVWDGGVWASTPQNFSGASPYTTPRRDWAIGFDNFRSRVVAFGGRFDDGGVTDETWQYTGLNWAQAAMSPATRPSPRRSAAISYDPVSHNTILYGGVNAAGNALYDTWSFNGSAWTQLDAGPPPYPSSASPMVYSRARSAPLLLDATTWQFAGGTTGWQKLNIPALVNQPIAGGTGSDGGFLFCAAARGTLDHGAQRYDFADGGWSLNSNWYIGPPTTREKARLTFDELRQKSVLLAEGTTWEYEPALGAVPAHVFEVNLASLQPPGGAGVDGVVAKFISGGNSATTAGAKLERWNGTYWLDAGVSNGLPGTELPISGSLQQLDINVMMDAGVARWRVTPRGPNAPGTAAQLSTDFAEVKVHMVVP